MTPDYIVANWTDELFNLMVEKLTERKERETEDRTGRHDKPEQKVSDMAFFRQAGIKVVKRGD